MHHPLPSSSEGPLPAGDFGLLLDCATDYGIVFIDPDKRIRGWSAGATRIFGHTREEAVGMEARLLFTPEDRERGEPEKEIAQADEGGRAPDERWHMRRSGERFWASGLLYRLIDGQGKHHGYVKILRDFTDKRRSAEALIENEKKLEFFLENLEDHSLFMLNPAGQIASWNRGAERLFGYGEAEIVGHPLTRLFTPEEASLPGALERSLSDGCQEERWLRRKDGSLFWGACTMLALRDDEEQLRGYARITRDATQGKRAEEAVRMESIGRLAGGVAHDFNNMLTAINGYCELLLGEAGAGHDPRPWIEEIQKAGSRAAGLTRQLLAFSRKQALAPRPLQLNEVVKSTEPLLQRTLGEDIRIFTALAPELERVLLDPAQLEQMILNLALNAREAMPEGGVIEIETADVAVGGGSPEPLPVEPGPYALLRFRDSGRGMEPEVKARVFEPFFSTKRQGTGSTGLGLSSVYGAVRQQGGAITVDSAPGHGTEFRLYFPVTREQGQPRARAPVPAEAPTGERTLLLVEDERSVRKLAAHVLGIYGYKVVEAKDGLEALAFLEAYPDGAHLVLTDVVMPNLGGLELAKRVQGLRPDLPIVFMSGYTEEAVLPQGLMEKANFLQKPFTIPALLARVREALTAPRAV